MHHTFWVGQAVRATRRLQGRTAVAAYEVIVLLPAQADGVPLYRLRSVEFGVEWVARQDRIEAI